MAIFNPALMAQFRAFSEGEMPDSFTLDDAPLVTTRARVKPAKEPSEVALAERLEVQVPEILTTPHDAEIADFARGTYTYAAGGTFRFEIVSVFPDRSHLAHRKALIKRLQEVPTQHFDLGCEVLDPQIVPVRGGTRVDWVAAVLQPDPARCWLQPVSTSEEGQTEGADTPGEVRWEIILAPDAPIFYQQRVRVWDPDDVTVPERIFAVVAPPEEPLEGAAKRVRVEEVNA